MYQLHFQILSPVMSLPLKENWRMLWAFQWNWLTDQPNWQLAAERQAMSVML
jgi:hypothetical protein